MRQADIIRVEDMARARFTYKPDPAKQDRWKSYHREVMQANRWADDCDSLASTVVNLLIEQYRWPTNKLWYANVDSNLDGTIDHMIAFAEDQEGGLWVIGDTFGKCYPANAMRHRLMKACKVSDILAWYEVKLITDLQRIP